MENSENSSHNTLFNEPPAVLLDTSGELLWNSKNSTHYLKSFLEKNQISDLFFDRDFDKIRQDSFLEPRLFPPAPGNLSGKNFFVTPLPNKQRLVQLVVAENNSLPYAISARIRENLQNMLPSLTYLSNKLEPLDDSFGEVLDSFTRKTLQIEQLLSLSRFLDPLSSDDLEQTADLTSLLVALCASIYAVTSHLNDQFHWSIPEKIVLVPGSEALLTSAVLSILSNAFENTSPNEEIFLALDVKNEQAILTVRDRGRGIPEGKKPFLFDPLFFPENRAYAPEFHLGLPTTYKIVHALGGNLLIHSEDGEGTLVTISLPLQSNPPLSLQQTAEDYLSNRHSPIYRFLSKLPIHPYY